MNKEPKKMIGEGEERNSKGRNAREKSYLKSRKRID